MNAFERVIGYENIKKELMQICDMIHNREVYARLGARIPRGILLYGRPGVGKTLLAECFLAESGLRAYTVRRDRGGEGFVAEITAAFRKAKENAPAVIFLDDIDKFSNEDDFHRDTEEYIAVQSGIDEVRGSEVFVIATANDIHKLPHSLRRSGRFDRKLELNGPTEADARKIIEHYLKDKKLSPDVNMDDFCGMIKYSSCAGLETILNEAAISAAYARRDSIGMGDLTTAVLRVEYEAAEDNAEAPEEQRRAIALHEAGHLVVSEALCPGSVGLASLRSGGGFVRRCRDLPHRSDNVLVSLGGKAAVELYCADAHEEGCRSDIERACEHIRDAISKNGVCGIGMLDVETFHSSSMSESLNARTEAMVQAELERYLLRAKDILLKNRAFLEAAADALLNRETLLQSDIRALREEKAASIPAI